MIRTISLTVIAGAIGACSMGGTINISEPSVAPESAIQLDKDGVLRLGELSISVKPENFKGGVLTAGPVLPIIPLGKGVDAKVEKGKFEIVVQFEASANGYEFAPNESILTIGDHQHFPISYAGPSTFTTGSREHHRSIPGHDWRCVRRSNDNAKTEGAIEIPLARSCIFLEYELETPDPSIDFSIILKGLKKNGEPVSLPEFRFTKGARGVFFLLG